MIGCLLAVLSAVATKRIVVFHGNHEQKSYVRADVDKISYLGADENATEMTIMRVHLKNGEHDDYDLSEVEEVIFAETSPFVVTRRNIVSTYLTCTLRGEIAGDLQGWTGCQLGYILSHERNPLAADDRMEVKSKIICDGPGTFEDAVDVTKYGFKGGERGYYVAFARQGNQVRYGQTESFKTSSVTFWTNKYANVEQEDTEGRYFKASVSAEIYGSTDEIESSGATVGFYYDTKELPSRAKGNKRQEGGLNEVKDIVAELKKLDAGTTYWFRPFVEIADTIYYGIDAMFTTNPWVGVNTLSPTNVKATTADVGYEVYDILAQQGQLVNGRVGIQFALDPNLDAQEESTYYDLEQWNMEKKSYTAYFTKLTPETDYYYRAYVVSGSKRYLGNIEHFKTTKLVPVTKEAVKVTPTTAHIDGLLEEKDAIVEGNYFGFYINETGEPGPDNGKYVNGTFNSNSDGTFYWDATGLEQKKTYYVRSFVTYKDKIYLGNVVSFTTTEEQFYGELGLFELKGHVQSCTWTNLYGSNTRTFNQNGFWLTGDGWSLSSIYDMGIRRDSQGRIINGAFEGGSESWTIDAKGRKTTWQEIVYDGGEKHTYYYNENDLVVSEKVEFIGMDIEWNTAYTITYSGWVLDNHGNWISRQSYTKEEGTTTETRIITYYDIPSLVSTKK